MSSQIYRLPLTVPEEREEEQPRLRYITTAQYSAEWNSTLHTHSCTELFFITGGHGSFHVGGSVFPIALNDVVIVNANIPHTEQSQSESPLSYIALGVDHMQSLDDLGGSTMIHLSGQQTQLFTLLELLVQEAQEQSEGWHAICQHLLEIFLQRLARRKDLTLSKPAAPGKTNRECELVRRYIDNHFKENLHLDDLAALAHINK